MAILLAPSTSVLSKLAVPRKAAAQRVLCRAAPEDKSSGATVFFAGEAYTEQEWRDAVSSGKLMNIASTSAPQAKAPQPQASFGEVMAFSGAAPGVLRVMPEWLRCCSSSTVCRDTI